MKRPFPVIAYTPTHSGSYLYMMSPALLPLLCCVVLSFMCCCFYVGVPWVVLCCVCFSLIVCCIVWTFKCLSYVLLWYYVLLPSCRILVYSCDMLGYLPAGGVVLSCCCVSPLLREAGVFCNWSDQIVFLSVCVLRKGYTVLWNLFVVRYMIYKKSLHTHIFWTRYWHYCFCIIILKQVLYAHNVQCLWI